MNSVNRIKCNHFIKSASVAALLVSVSAIQAETTPQQSYLPLETALKAATTTMKKCTGDGYRVSVAVVDRGGNLLAFVRHPLAGPHTVNSSRGKAFTAASMGRSTAGLSKMIAEKPFLAGLRDMDDRLVILGGGLPVSIGETHVGGIGVGGAPGGHLDEACAQAGLDAIK
jgi:uncharacterized protein GlcG (DUF336 family)